MIRVVVVDDQALVRGGFRLILETQPDIEVVGEAADGREAVARAQEQRPDVVLMDIRMPGMNGLEATRRLMTTQNPPRVLMLTTFDLDEYVYDALRAGASGFLLKDVRPEQLADAVRAVATGETLPVILQPVDADCWPPVGTVTGGRHGHGWASEQSGCPSNLPYELDHLLNRDGLPHARWRVCALKRWFASKPDYDTVTWVDHAPRSLRAGLARTSWD
jgi:CheY-like chemotaxis protein